MCFRVGGGTIRNLGETEHMVHMFEAEIVRIVVTVNSYFSQIRRPLIIFFEGETIVVLSVLTG